MKKIFLATTALLCTFTALGLASAQDANTTAVAATPAVAAVSNETEIKALQTNIANLQAEYEKLKAAVTAGTMTKADAQTAWKKLIDDARAQKKTIFEKRIADITTRYKKLEDKRPEVAAVVKEKVDMLQQKRKEAEAARADIQAKIKAGTITKDQANAMRKEVVDQGKAKIEEIKGTIEAKREELKEQVKAGMIENKMIKGEAGKRMEELKNSVASGTPKLGEKARGEIKNILDDAKARMEVNRAKLENRAPLGGDRPAPMPGQTQGSMPVSPTAAPAPTQ